MFKSALGVAALAATALAESACPQEVITTTASYTYSDITATYVTITPTDYVTRSTETPTVYSATVTETTTVERGGVDACAETTTKFVLRQYYYDFFFIDDADLFCHLGVSTTPPRFILATTLRLLSAPRHRAPQSRRL
jgi:hypothetical protein